MTDDLITVRDRVVQAAPRWLRGWWGSRLLRTIGTQFDSLIDWAAMAVRVRYASWAAGNAPDALAVIGRERGIRRGFVEVGADYAVRLQGWIDARKNKGGRYTTMDQLAGYLSGFAVKMRVVNCNGAWCTRNADGSREYHRASPSNWNWDGHPEKSSRYWVILYPPADLMTDEGDWGDAGTWGDGGTIGTTASPELVASIRAIVAEWNPPHAICAGIIIALDPTSFDPTGSGAGYPDGTWGEGTHVVAGNRESSRLETARYWEMTDG
jgi:hypothetical protein